MVCALYRHAGIRSVEIGSVMFGRSDPETGGDSAGAAPTRPSMELVRLAIPRRVYTQSHIDYVVEVILEVWAAREKIRGMKITYEAPFLRHFTARMATA